MPRVGSLVPGFQGWRFTGIVLLKKLHYRYRVVDYLFTRIRPSWPSMASGLSWKSRYSVDLHPWRSYYSMVRLPPPSIPPLRPGQPSTGTCWHRCGCGRPAEGSTRFPPRMRRPCWRTPGD